MTLTLAGPTVIVKNTSGAELRIAGSLGLEMMDERGEWIDAHPLLERLANTAVASPLKLRVLQPGEEALLAVPFFEVLPPGRYRVTVAYSTSGKNATETAVFDR